jgi:hypothetical protein
MGIRNLLEQHQGAAIVIIAIILASSAVIILRSGAITTPDKQAYFFDLDTGELFTADRELQAPIAAPSGEGNGMRAVVFGCGSCNADDLRVAYIMKYSDDAGTAIGPDMAGAGDAPPQQLAGAVQKEPLVAAPPAAGEQPQWVVTSSPQGSTIQSRASFVCGPKAAQPCVP